MYLNSLLSLGSTSLLAVGGTLHLQTLLAIALLGTLIDACWGCRAFGRLLAWFWSILDLLSRSGPLLSGSRAPFHRASRRDRSGRRSWSLGGRVQKGLSVASLRLDALVALLHSIDNSLNAGVLANSLDTFSDLVDNPGTLLESLLEVAGAPLGCILNSFPAELRLWFTGFEERSSRTGREFASKKLIC